MTTVDELKDLSPEDLWKRFIELSAENARLRNENHTLAGDNVRLSETIKIYQLRLFAKKSEKLPKEQQPGLFDEAEGEEKKLAADTPQEKVRVCYERIKTAGRKPLPSDLPRVEEKIDFSDEQKAQMERTGTLKRIGADINEKLEIIPQRIHVLKQITYKYSYKPHNGESKIITPSKKEQLLPQGIATPSSASYVMTSKFVDGIPFYRQERIFKRLQIDVSRQTMANWQIYLYYNYLSRLIDLMKRDLHQSYLVGVDETPVQVVVAKNKPPSGKSYMWVYRGYQTDKVILLYDYQPDKKGIHPKDYLTGYSGYLQTDGYRGYNDLASSGQIKHLGCWAHVRRKFVEYFKGLKNQEQHEDRIILDLIGSLYTVEKQIRENKLSPEAVYQLRQAQSVPLVKKIQSWLKENVTKYPPSLHMGKAINYALNQWDSLIVYLEDGRLPIDNNLVENAIRPFVIGRKNWLFSYSTKGAASSAAFYSLIETAKANNKEPYAYLKELFEKLPSAQNDQDYRKLLPYNL